MRRLRIGIIDLVVNAPARSFYSRIMNANSASIMPQVIACWCEEEGHSVQYFCYTGFENLLAEIPINADIVFIGAFTESAQLAYALSNLLRSNGVVTVLGGPHARCYPQDAQNYFDYVIGFTNKTLISEVLHDCTHYSQPGIYLSARQQPGTLPGVRQRWKFIKQTLQKAYFLKLVPMVGSLGCPYSCEFCIDSVVPYQPLDFDMLKEDLRFILRKFRRPRVAWYDPNFGIQFSDYMDAIEEAIPPDSIDFMAETNLSILSEAHIKRLQQNGFKAVFLGIESWFYLSKKTRSGNLEGIEKVKHVSEHINMILRHIPYVQTCFVFGLDVDKGSEPFELTKRFVDMTPGVFPAYCLLSAFGQAAPHNLEYQREKRLLPFPYHFLSNRTLNVKPKYYSWIEFYAYVIDITKYTFSRRSIFNRLVATKALIPRWLTALRGLSSEGLGRIKYYTEVHQRLRTDRQVRRFFEQETSELPQFYVNQIRDDLGPLWKWLPKRGLYHDPNTYQKSKKELARTTFNGCHKRQRGVNT